MDDDLTLLLDLADELGHGNLVRGSETIKAAWEWNQIHKKGSKYRLYSLAELAKALRSTNDRSLLNQMVTHEGCKLCMDECVVSGCKTLVPMDKNRKTESAYCDAHLPTGYKTNSKSMDNPRASASLPTGVSKPLMVTKRMEADLRARGFAQTEIDRMTPEQAHEKLSEPAARCPHGNNLGQCQLCVDEESNQCQHGNASATCYECSHPPNADCRWKECCKRFHAEYRTQQFCSPECAAADKKRNDELMTKYAKPAPAPFNGFAAFLDGQEQ
jgi:hypothetical protein